MGSHLRWPIKYMPTELIFLTLIDKVGDPMLVPISNIAVIIVARSDTEQMTRIYLKEPHVERMYVDVQETPSEIQERLLELLENYQ